MQLFPAAPGFDDPLGMLQACHTRILRQCDSLILLARHLADRGVTGEAHETARQVHRYFTTAGRHHHEDEEVDLFPLLLGASPGLADVIAALKHDHRGMEQLWSQIEPLLAEITPAVDPEMLTRRALEFRATYAAHIEHENAKILPEARSVLSSRQISDLGANMARRRGVRL